MDSRPYTEKQRLFMDDLGIAHFDGMTIKEASDLIDSELSQKTPDGPATPKQIAIVRALARVGKIEVSISSRTRRDVALDINALRGVADVPR